MVNVFNDPRYALQYEHVNLDLGDVYGNYARATINLGKKGGGFQKTSRVLDLGCGTGISTSNLFDMIEGVSVVGVDQSRPFLNLARLKFGLLGPSEYDSIYQTIRVNHPYPQILREKCEIGDLEVHLRETEKYRKFRDNITFYQKDASKLSDIPEDPFDCILASQVFHWFRSRDATSELPNIDYENKVMQQIRSSLREDGLFAFNTTGSHYRFEDESLNEIDISNHPFYRAFIEAMHSKLGTEPPKKAYKFNEAEIQKIMAKNGFRIRRSIQTTYKFEPEQLILKCLIGGHMQIFQKEKIDLPMEEREEMLEKALNCAYKKSTPEARSVSEIGLHYVVEKL